MPAIVGVAVLVPPLGFGQDWDIWIYLALALLLIGCPCALVILVPASIKSALSSGVRHGLADGRRGGDWGRGAGQPGSLRQDRHLKPRQTRYHRTS